MQTRNNRGRGRQGLAAKPVKGSSKKSSHKSGERADSSSRALLVVDQAPLRQSAIDDCLRAQHKLETLRASVQKFQNNDRPLFAAWCLDRFEKEIERGRTLENEIREKAALLEEIQMMIHTEGLTPRQAYREAMDDFHEMKQEELERQQAQEDRFQWDRSQEQNEPEPDENVEGDDGDEARLRAIFDELMSSYGARVSRAEREAAFQDFCRDFRGRHNKNSHESKHERGQDSAHGHATSMGRTQSLKQLYRSIARVLHPDLNAELTAERKDLWQRVQNAYIDRDLAVMQSLSVLVQLACGEVSEQTQISGLWAAFQDLKARLGQVQRELASLKKEPSWGFAEKSQKQLNLLARKIEGTFRNDLAQAEGILQELEDDLQMISQSKIRRRARGRLTWL